MPTQEEVVQALGQMSVMELISLTKTLEEKWGVKAVPPTVVQQPSRDEAPKQTESEQTEFAVWLVGVGDKKIDVIKALRQATGLGLKEAKDFAEAVPKMLKEGLSKDDAQALKVAFEAAGAKVELK